MNNEETMADRSVVVFGGTGFIGSRLVARLSEQGMTIVLPTRHEANGTALMLLPGVDIVEADIHDDATLRRLVAGKGAVINLVGVLHSDRGTPYGAAFRRAHVDLPRRIVDACAAAGVPRYLHMSALGADVHGPSMYQRSKADGEAAATSQPSVETTIFRPSVVFGEGDQFLTMFASLQRFLPLVPLAGASARFQPVYVGDVADAFVRALLEPRSAHKIYELGGPQVHTLGELVSLAGRYAGHERKVIGLPDALARLQARFFEILPGTPIMTRDNLDSMRVDNVLKESASNNVLTAAALGIKLTPLEAVAPRYLSPAGRLDTLRTRAGR